MSRLHDENRNLYARLTDSEAQLTEAQTYGSKGWDLWGKICAEKLDLQKDLDGERDKREMRARQDKKDGLQAGRRRLSIPGLGCVSWKSWHSTRTAKREAMRNH